MKLVPAFRLVPIRRLPALAAFLAVTLAFLTVLPSIPALAAGVSVCAKNVAEAGQYSLVYELPIPVKGNYLSTPPRPTR